MKEIMFDRKLTKYKNIIGFAYEVGTYEVNIYLVIKKNNDINFKLYKYYDFNTKNKIDEFINKLEEQDYKSIKNWKDNLCKKLIKQVM